MLRLGLCCQTITLRYAEKEITGSRSIALKTIEKKGIEEAERRALLNIKDLGVMMRWMRERGITVFRLPSDMIPHGSNRTLSELYPIKGKRYNKLLFCKEELKELGKIAKELGIRCTFHPGQYNQLGTPSKDVLRRTFYELDMHCKILDLMGVDQDGVVVLHGGGTYGNIEKTSDRITEVINLLPERISRRLVLENDEKCYSSDDLLKICKKTNTPLVFDIHHFICYEEKYPGKQTSIEEILPEILETWKAKGIKPKFHISEQDVDKRLGAHSFYIENIQSVLLEIPEKFKTNLDLMIEAKGKDFAIEKLYRKYPFLCQEERLSISLKIPQKAQKDYGQHNLE
jgi:UV DNA damage endonuclease